jgi:hypothetical protein
MTPIGFAKYKVKKKYKNPRRQCRTSLKKTPRKKQQNPKISKRQKQQ